MNVIIAGSRGFTSYETLKATMAALDLAHQDCLIISGGARGADKLGEQWAKEFGKTLTIMKADWDHFGKSAGYKRNKEMAKVATHLVAFWDGASKGTAHMIDIARDHGL